MEGVVVLSLFATVPDTLTKDVKGHLEQNSEGTFSLKIQLADSQCSVYSSS